MSKWIIPAPKWEASGSYVQANTRLGSIWERENYPGFLASAYCGKALTVAFDTEAEARAWVEKAVMEAMGATPLDMPELSPADKLMTAEEAAHRAWNEAIEAAAFRAWSTGMELYMKKTDAREIGSKCASVIRALTRGDGNE